MAQTEGEYCLPQGEIRKRIADVTARSKTVPHLARKNITPDGFVRMNDIARMLGKSETHLRNLAQGKAEFRGDDQIKLSRILLALESGALAKVTPPSGRAHLAWVKPQNTPELARTSGYSLEVGPTGPRFKRTPVP